MLLFLYYVSIVLTDSNMLQLWSISYKTEAFVDHGFFCLYFIFQWLVVLLLLLLANGLWMFRRRSRRRIYRISSMRDNN